MMNIQFFLTVIIFPAIVVIVISIIAESRFSDGRNWSILRFSYREEQ